MSYEYTNPKRANEPHALPDVEVLMENYRLCKACGELTLGFPYAETCECGDKNFELTATIGKGYFYAYGLPGCLWDSDPIGPFETYDEALENARENAGVFEEED